MDTRLIFFYIVILVFMSEPSRCFREELLQHHAGQDQRSGDGGENGTASTIEVTIAYDGEETGEGFHQ